MDNHDMMTGCIVAATLAFVVLCIYGIRALITVRRSLSTIESAVSEAKETLSVARQGLERTLRAADEISADVQDKLHAADSLFNAVRDAGSTIKTIAATVRAVGGSFSRDWLSGTLQAILFHFFGERVTKSQAAKEEREDEIIREAGKQRSRSG